MRESLTEETKRIAFLLLMSMALKRNGYMNSRGTASGSLQKNFARKIDCTSPAPDFNSLKRAEAVAAKEERGTGAVYLPGFSLQAKASEDNEPLMIKLSGDAALLLFECDERKWRNYLRR